MQAAELNRRLATERHRRGRGLVRSPDRILWSSNLDELPIGTVVADPSTGGSHLVTKHHLRPFNFEGWGPPVERPLDVNVEVLTPPTSVAALRNGFSPHLHPTAGS